MAQYTAHHTGKRIDAARDCPTMAITLPAWKESLSPPSRTVFARNIGLTIEPCRRRTSIPNPSRSTQNRGLSPTLKCVVIDGRPAFVSSAIFTEAGRNSENSWAPSVPQRLFEQRWGSAVVEYAGAGANDRAMVLPWRERHGKPWREVSRCARPGE